MPCHSMPLYSLLHRNIPMRFLDCSPPGEFLNVLSLVLVASLSHDNILCINCAVISLTHNFMVSLFFDHNECLTPPLDILHTGWVDQVIALNSNLGSVDIPSDRRVSTPSPIRSGSEEKKFLQNPSRWLEEHLPRGIVYICKVLQEMFLNTLIFHDSIA